MDINESHKRCASCTIPKIAHTVGIPVLSLYSSSEFNGDSSPVLVDDAFKSTAVDSFPVLCMKVSSFDIAGTDRSEF